MLGTQGKGATWQTKRSAGKEPRPPPTGVTAGQTGDRCTGVTSLCCRHQALGGLLWASTSPSAYQWLGWKVSNSGSPSNCVRSTRGYQGCRSEQGAAALGGLGSVRGPLWGQPGSAQLLELRGGWQQDTRGAGVPEGLLALNPTPPGLRGKLAAASSCHLGLKRCPGERCAGSTLQDGFRREVGMTHGCLLALRGPLLGGSPLAAPVRLHKGRNVTEYLQRGSPQLYVLGVLPHRVLPPACMSSLCK